MDFESIMIWVLIALIVIGSILIIFVFQSFFDEMEIKKNIQIWTVENKGIRSDGQFYFDLTSEYSYKNKTRTASKRNIVSENMYRAYEIGDVIDFSDIDFTEAAYEDN